MPFPGRVQAAQKPAGPLDLSAYSDVFTRLHAASSYAGSGDEGAIARPSTRRRGGRRRRLDKPVVHMGPEVRLAVLLILGPIGCRSFTNRQSIVFESLHSADQDLTDLFSTEQPHAFGGVDRTFSTCLSTGSVGISEMPTGADVLPCSCESGTEVLLLSYENFEPWLCRIRPADRSSLGGGSGGSGG